MEPLPLTLEHLVPELHVAIGSALAVPSAKSEAGSSASADRPPRKTASVDLCEACAASIFACASPGPPGAASYASVTEGQGAARSNVARKASSPATRASTAARH